MTISPALLSSCGISLEQVGQVLRSVEAELALRRAQNRLAAYRPYSKQAGFHGAGLAYRERALFGANQSGKTLCAGMEIAMHLTGRYPEGWMGKRFSAAVVGWCGGVTGEATRDNPQRILLGRVGEWGTGTIPKDALGSITRAAHRSPDAVDTIRVRHVTGGYSSLAFKSYDQGREKWQGETLDLVWFDEEPPEDIYMEGMTRTNVSTGPVMLTFTPLLGMSNVVKRFLIDKKPGTHVTFLPLEEAEHYTEEQRAQIIASYPEHELEARTKGIPVMGSGRVFPVKEEILRYDAMEFPKHWPRIAGIDFGWDHPTACVWLCWNRDADTVYVYDAYRRSKENVATHASAIRGRGDWIPVAWPHDGENDTAAGKNLASQYRDEKLKFLPERATFEDGSNSVEAGLMMMLDRMKKGQLRVAAHLNDWWEEFRLYHRKDGKVVKENDDLMSATRYALMMLRFAQVNQVAKPRDYSRIDRAVH